MTNQIIGNIPFFPEEHPFEDVYNAYTAKVKGLFSPLASDNKVIEVGTRLFTGISLPIVYPLMALSKQIYDRSPPDTVYQADIRLKKQLAWLKTQQPEGWEKASLKLIKHGRHTDPSMELKRLRRLNVLTSTRESKLDGALSRVSITSLSPDRQRTKMLIAQALEIKEIYKKTHHVFLHAQATKWVIFSHIVKECMRRFEPEVDLEQYKFLRAPTDTTDLGFLKSIFSFIFGKKKPYETVQRFLDSKYLPVNDSNTEDRDNLLSVDGYFYNYHKWESSLFFLINNDNIFNNATVIQDFAKKVFKHFCPKLKDKARIDSYAKEISQAAFKKAACGNLFVICLPKEKSHEIQYRAHPFGPPCTCHPKWKAASILNALQEENFNYTNKCKTMPAVPQYRLYAPKLTPGDGKAVYLLTPFTKAQRQEIKAPVKRVANELEKIAQASKK